MSIDAAGLSKMLREDRAEWDALVVPLDAHPHQVLYGGASVWASRDVYAHLLGAMFERRLRAIQAVPPARWRDTPKLHHHHFALWRSPCRAELRRDHSLFTCLAVALPLAEAMPPQLRQEGKPEAKGHVDRQQLRAFDPVRFAVKGDEGTDRDRGDERRELVLIELELKMMPERQAYQDGREQNRCR
jgi:hypothetical protein